MAPAAPPAGATRAAPAAPSGARDAAGRPSRSGDEFERALRRKAQARDDAAPACGGESDRESDTERTDANDGGAAAASAPAAMPQPEMPPLPPALRAPAIRSAFAESAGLVPSEVAATATAAARGHLGSSPEAAGLTAASLHGDESGRWAVSLNDPRGVALELCAMRPGGLQPSAQAPAWTLAIASPVLGAAQLAQHLPQLQRRLNEGVQTRRIGPTHLRIEDESDPASPR